MLTYLVILLKMLKGDRLLRAPNARWGKAAPTAMVLNQALGLNP